MYLQMHHSHSGERSTENLLQEQGQQNRPQGVVIRTGDGRQEGGTPSWYGRGGGWLDDGNERKMCPEDYREWWKEAGAAEESCEGDCDKETVKKFDDGPPPREASQHRDQVKELDNVLDGKKASLRITMTK